jgi:hypothetical protein
MTWAVIDSRGLRWPVGADHISALSIAIALRAKGIRCAIVGSTEETK